MAKEKTKAGETKNLAEKKLSREEIMKVPGWSNVVKGSPQTVKSTKTEAE